MQIQHDHFHSPDVNIAMGIKVPFLSKVQFKKTEELNDNGSISTGNSC